MQVAVCHDACVTTHETGTHDSLTWEPLLRAGSLSRARSSPGSVDGSEYTNRYEGSENFLSTNGVLEDDEGGTNEAITESKDAVCYFEMRMPLERISKLLPIKGCRCKSSWREYKQERYQGYGRWQ